MKNYFYSLARIAEFDFDILATLLERGLFGAPSTARGLAGHARAFTPAFARSSLHLFVKIGVVAAVIRHLYSLASHAVAQVASLFRRELGVLFPGAGAED